MNLVPWVPETCPGFLLLQTGSTDLGQAIMFHIVHLSKHVHVLYKEVRVDGEG